MSKIKNIIYLFFSYCLILIGFLYLYIFIYFQFIRERLPKDIPWELNDFRFYLLIFICFIYIIQIKVLLYPPKPNILLIKSVQYLQHFFKPFISLDTFLKHNKYSYSYYKRFMINFAEKYIEERISYLHRIFFIYMFKLLPRIILLLIFIVDIFFVHKIEIFYYFLFLGILPLIYDYILYSLRFFLENLIQDIEKEYKSVWIILKKWDWTSENEHLNKNDIIYHDKYVSIREYIAIQIDLYMKDDYVFDEYEGIPINHDFIIEKYKDEHKLTELTIIEYNKLEKTFQNNMPIILIIAINLYLNNRNFISDNIPKIKLSISVAYLICWIFIFGVSTFVFPPSFEYTLIFLNNILENLMNEEPFSFCNIFDQTFIQYLDPYDIKNDI